MSNTPPSQAEGTADQTQEEHPRQIIDIDQLRVGLYIELDIGWLDHPFMFRSFRIKDEKQLQILKKLGLEVVAYDPSKSTAEPLEKDKQPAAEPAAASLESSELDEMWAEKNQCIERMKARRQQVQQCSKRFEQTVAFMKKALREVRAHPDKSVDAAEQIIDGMVGSLSKDPNSALHLVNVKEGGVGEYAHFINVTVLSLMLGRALGLSGEEMRLLGIGAIFHDFGTLQVPEKILRKSSLLNVAERKFYEMHPEYGLKVGKGLGRLPPEVLAIIAQHHETVDGQGYPRKLKDRQIYKLAKVVAIADTYDVLCNNRVANKSLSPYEAVSYMFAKKKSNFDEGMLNAFISSLGVYPPGTVVSLSNDKVGLVVSINPDNLLKPNVMLYSGSIPKEEAAIIDLREEDITVIKSIRPTMLPGVMYKYLGLGTNVNHFFNTTPAPQG